MFEWLTRRRLPAPTLEVAAAPARARGRSMSGPYVLLHTYLDTRFADTVVLTFAQIEDLLGFALPAQARAEPAWWTADSTDSVTPHHSDSWTLAKRSAVPNMTAQIVSFARAF
jgi:hypothetical protein